MNAIRRSARWLPGLLLAAGCARRDGAPDGSGTIECTQVQIAPQVPGRIVELGPREGDAVRKGEVVARLDAADYQLRLGEARAGLALAQAQLDLVHAGARQEDVERARAQLAEARAAERAAGADAERIGQVFAKGSATPKQRDDARALAERTAAAAAAAEQALNRLVHGSRPEEIRMAAAAVDQARARVAQLEKAAADCTVTAPEDGAVTTRNREPGEFVNAGATLLTLSRLSNVWLAIYIPEPRLAGVKIGQPAYVRVDGSATLHTGTVTFVAQEAEFTPRNVQTRDERAKLVYRVKIALDNPARLFKPGMPADGFLEKQGGG